MKTIGQSDLITGNTWAEMRLCVQYDTSMMRSVFGRLSTHNINTADSDANDDNNDEDTWRTIHECIVFMPNEPINQVNSSKT